MSNEIAFHSLPDPKLAPINAWGASADAERQVARRLQAYEFEVMYQRRDHGDDTLGFHRGPMRVLRDFVRRLVFHAPA